MFFPFLLFPLAGERASMYNAAVLECAVQLLRHWLPEIGA
jgi:hypothetical protein